MAGRPADAILAGLEPLGVRLGLDTFRELLAALDSPERATPSVIVAGTNGKGTVAALLASITAAAGLRTGLYTSPHLDSYRERIRIDGEPIDDDALATTLERVLAAAAGAGLPPPTVFEALTATAFLVFAARKLDVAVLEVGLGGRLDATNAAEPVLSVVTRIGIDHRAELGDTLESIAREKAGVLRAGVPAIVAPQPEAAETALAAAAAGLGAPLLRVEERCVVEHAEWLGLDGHRLRLRAAVGVYELAVPFAGEHQIDNAATAVLAAEQLTTRWPAIGAAAISRGVATGRWPGRLEALTLPGGTTTLLLDAAHNADGCAALARFLDRLGEPFDLLFGCLADKDAGAMLPALAARAGRVFLSRPRSPRALAPEQLASWLPQGVPAERVDEPAAALSAALAARPRLLVVAGSIYLVAELRRDALRAGARPRRA